MVWKLILAASLVLACPSKDGLPSAAKRLANDRANPLIILGNQAAAARFLRAAK